MCSWLKCTAIITTIMTAIGGVARSSWLDGIATTTTITTTITTITTDDRDITKAPAHDPRGLFT